VWRDDELMATGYTHNVCMNREGKVLRPTAELKNLCGTGG
jgi:acyl-CoA thioesterase FadM